MKVITISYTPLDAPGGVPRFNRDIHSAFPGAVHYSWWDVAQYMKIDPNAQIIPEWEKALVLSSWLLRTKRVTEQDVVIADSFWADGLQHLPFCISHQHGNWSHTTLDDVKKGIPPEFPLHAAVQKDFRYRYLRAGRKLTTVSQFIADQMRYQWNMVSTVINNGIDCEKFKPAEKKVPRRRPIIIHFTTTANKGFDHIEAVKELDADVWLLDEAEQKLGIPKYEALAQADLVVHPSAHEGNSYAVLETLACDVPIVGYDVGLLYEIKKIVERTSALREWDPAPKFEPTPGFIIDRSMRRPSETKMWAEEALHAVTENIWNPRKWAEKNDISVFRREWKGYVDDLVSSR